MTVFLSLLPVYLFGNLHCAGMCGPLVMLLAKHRFRWCYFLGRLFSFTIAGMLSAEMGMALFSFLNRFHVSAAFSLGFGFWIALVGILLFFNRRLPGSEWFAKRSARLSVALSSLMTKNSPQAVFLFGTCTLLLPCGQTILVFSVIALNGSPLIGLLNGFLFALLTSPSLIAAMHASQFFQKKRKGYHLWMGGAALLIGSLAFLRGLADLHLISHFILNPTAPVHFHIVVF